MYGEVKELLPDDAPTPLVNYFSLTHCVDANLFHDQLTSIYVTGILHVFNKNPVDWNYKKQSTAETSTYAYEFSFFPYMCVIYY